MQANQAWIGLFRRIPVDLHDTLALGLTTGSEIVVQKIVKLEPDFMIIRGRLAGTQDTGRLVMVPYPQLTFVAIQRDLKDGPDRTGRQPAIGEDFRAVCTVECERVVRAHVRTVMWRV